MQDPSCNGFSSLDGGQPWEDVGLGTDDCSGIVKVQCLLLYIQLKFYIYLRS